MATVHVGGIATGILIQPYIDHAPKDGLPGAGLLIGRLERLVIFVLILTGQPQAIGFLIAAKSILRFEPSPNAGHNAKNEYVIIGTLASFGWALCSAWLTVALLEQLPDLGIPTISP
ncbi:hypothetical protein BFP70_03195 [Thioclava sp. SK-1]|nr:hypothetical protein BFP70_03195 [Thioclava sp. SK-1]